MDQNVAEAIYKLAIKAHKNLSEIWAHELDLTSTESTALKKSTEIPIATIQNEILSVVVRQYPDIK